MKQPSEINETDKRLLVISVRMRYW